MYVLTIEEGPVGVYSTQQNMIAVAKEYAGDCGIDDLDFDDLDSALEELGMAYYHFVLDTAPV